MFSHYHEAAYDAYMTGFAFANIIKYKEIEQPKDGKKKYYDNKSKVQKPLEEEKKGDID